MRFASREEAGTRLAEHLKEQEIQADLVLGLPRGGIVVAAPVARKLNVPLAAWAVRKIGHPLNPEFAVGALAEPDVLWLEERFVRADPGLHRGLVERVRLEQVTLQEMAHRLHLHGPPELRHRRVLIVDDGLATGATAYAAVLAARKLDAEHVMVAAPVGSTEAVHRLRQGADEVHILWPDPDFIAVGHYYDAFDPPDESEILRLLKEQGEA
ncbi:MAG: phosphoribosyltransferase family protein [Verrucomicrobiota bacterium]|nr:phosphoribosyltransferase family protein [Limisphaera sp.]MDW8381530.1 phosphoribosyltransferase family protein [Verrucomicrobiota bacterium]